MQSHHVQERKEFAAGAGLLTVHIVHGGDEADFPLRKEHFRAAAGLQTVAAKPAHVPDDHHLGMPRLQEFLPVRDAAASAGQFVTS